MSSDMLLCYQNNTYMCVIDLLRGTSRHLLKANADNLHVYGLTHVYNGH